METPQGRLSELVGKLDALGSDPALVELAQALQTAQLTPADVAPYVRTNSQNYNRAWVVLREQYELLVMTWLPGQASVPHDHRGSICAMQVVQGTAAEGCYGVADDGYAELEYETALEAGEVTSGQDAGVHTVRNPSRTGETLVTVHIYAPPLTDIRRFVPRPEPADEALSAIRDATPTVVIVGGGFSGSATAAQILRRAVSPVRVVLVERRGAVGEGVAYGTQDACHLLNVPAGKMSAWPERPDDFVRWASARYGAQAPGAFLPRKWYGEYVRETLLAAADEVGSLAKLSVVFDEVRRVDRHPAGGWMVHLERRASLHADAVILAIGHRPPSDPLGAQWTGPKTRFIADPWRPFAMNVVGPDDAVVVLGSGLTAVDTVLSLSQQPRRAPIVLVSRHGLLPQSHAEAPVAPLNLEPWISEVLATPGGVRARTVLGYLRRTARKLAAAGGDWRGVIDGLRPHTANLWRAMPTAERRRFLSRLRPFWEVHRHRMARSIAERMRTLLDRGDVFVIAGRVEAARAEEDGVRLVVRERGNERLIESQTAWVINCTGPMPSNSAESNPVVGSLLIHGELQADELALGIETTSDGNAIDAEGRVAPDMFVVGTLRKPASWESTAVPELRAQAAAVAERALEWVIHHCGESEAPSEPRSPRCGRNAERATSESRPSVLGAT